VSDEKKKHRDRSSSKSAVRAPTLHLKEGRFRINGLEKALPSQNYKTTREKEGKERPVGTGNRTTSTGGLFYLEKGKQR